MNKNLFYGALMTASIILNSLVTVALIKANETKFVSFDMKETVDIFSRQVVEQKNSEQTVQSLTVKFNKSMQSVLGDYSKNNHVIILVKPAVIEGAQDVTPELQRKIAMMMQGK